MDYEMMQHPHTDDDLYGLLGVHSAASVEEIRRAYRKRAMTYHPDRNVSDGAEETFKRIRSAYEILRDAKRRADYDRDAAREQDTADQQASAAQPEPPPGRAPNLSRRARITLDEQLRGCRVKLKLTRTEYCRRCGGSGDNDVPPVICGTCRGSGRVRHSLGLFSFFSAETIACTDCGGQGTVRPKCGACEGKGVEARKTGRLRFEIPAGIRPGASLRVRGHGRRGRSGEASGDLLIRVEIAPHPLFKPDFPHLRCEMPISVFRALAGGSLEVPTLETPVSVPLSAGLVDGAELRIDGQGMLDAANGQRGDLVVTLRLIRPQVLSDTQLELLAELERHAASEPALIDWVGRLRDAERVKQQSDRESERE